MNHPEFNLPPHYQHFLDRVIAACQSDEHVIALFLTGSYARGSPDAYSDLDFILIIKPDAYQDFIAGKKDFIRRLGEPLSLEDFEYPSALLCTFTDGVEIDLGIHSPEQVDQLDSAPYRVLLDKQGLFPKAVFTPTRLPPDDQVETLRRLIFWFWHDLSHFIKAFGRGQLWFAQGELEILRGYCINLARLRHDFTTLVSLDEPYFKLENVLPVEILMPLQATFCPLEPEAVLRSARTILHFYQELARPLAREHGLEYPERLERILVAHLEKISTRDESF